VQSWESPERLKYRWKEGYSWEARTASSRDHIWSTWAGESGRCSLGVGVKHGVGGAVGDIGWPEMDEMEGEVGVEGFIRGFRSLRCRGFSVVRGGGGGVKRLGRFRDEERLGGS